ncbi:glycosyltransferase family 4 protein [Chelativorans sp. SCAU2101]|uniref:Glycosyltransferase family 4 protein n=1 Tax=Chelativorans petroleitrophicus TaxID=2975484 RepID=A0A9X3B0W5_9HYPH|nr:glycosyltransferase family 4 protein [Chelativorans petroleitrophicus]MCT8992269.1 glycosyltransferase family 4 protein [Chelativorans petroleitrophicus]
MKICFVIPSLNSGGAERVAVTLARNLAKTDSVVLVTLDGGSRDFYSVPDNVERIALDRLRPSPGFVSAIFNNLAIVRDLRRIILSEKADVVLGFMPTCNILSGLAAAGTRCIAIGSEHNYPPCLPLGVAWTFLRRIIYPRLGAVTALTAQTGDWLRLHTGCRGVPIIPNPISFPLPIERNASIIPPAPILQELGGELLLLAVGRLTPQKGFDLLLPAFSKLHAKFPEWRLVILGEGPDREQLLDQIEELGLEDAVALPGVVGNLGDWFSAADVYVMSSRFEGFGNTLAEALCYGLPSVSFDCPFGPRDIIRDGIDGILVRPNDIDALAAALETVMGNEILRANMSSRAVEARSRFSEVHISDRWRSLFVGLLPERELRN